jgi:pyridoxamine 5'-phosphate oxidase
VITEMLASLMSTHDLTEPPQPDPMPLLIEWFREAERSGKYKDHNAFCLATATPDGVPSARMVLCKTIEPQGSLTFFTNYESRKGLELASNPRAAAVFHWPHAGRQARLEGTIQRVSAAESDEYFRSRSLLSRIGASVSRQSTPIVSRAQLVSAAMPLARAAATGAEIPRPAHWGGFRLTARAVELWANREGRLHQRILWRRSDTDRAGGWDPILLAP